MLCTPIHKQSEPVLERPDITSTLQDTRRSYLFLQGPASPIFRVVADHLETAGHEVRHISFCLGDWIFWRLKNTRWFRGTPARWQGFLDRFIPQYGVTDLVMLGDGRPVHAEAIDVAFQHGCRVHIIEHGYIRPDWLTIEPDGMSGHSRFPKAPDEIAALASGLPSPNLDALYRPSFLTYATYDLIYHLPNVALGWLVHPHYRRHGPVHPLVEYAGWIWKAIKSPWEKQHREATLHQVFAADAPLFVFPLQLPGDYQIKIHAPGGDLFGLVEAVIGNFAVNAPPDARLLFKVHPIDNGLSGWHRRIGDMARMNAVEPRVFVVDGGSLDTMIARASGLVTINSTVGMTALAAGKPVIALGNAIFAIEGLTHQGSLAAFWMMPTPPDEALFDAFIRLLTDRIQLRGGFIGGQAIADGAAALAARLMETQDRLPVSARRPRPNRDFRYEAELIGR